MIDWLNEVKIDLSDKELIYYLNHKINQLILDTSYRDYEGKILLTMASNCHIENGKDFSDIRKMLFGKIKIDMRSGEEIISDTFKKHGLKIKEK